MCSGISLDIFENTINLFDVHFVKCSNLVCVENVLPSATDENETAIIVDFMHNL